MDLRGHIITLFLVLAANSSWATVGVVKYGSGTPVYVCQASDSNPQCGGGGSGSGTVSSGTIGQEAVYTGTTTVGSGIITDTGTNIGIGSTTPAQLLDVQGTVQHLYVATNGNVGIGTVNPITQLQMTGNIQTGGVTVVNFGSFSNASANTTSNLYNCTGNSLTSGSCIGSNSTSNTLTGAVISASLSATTATGNAGKFTSTSPGAAVIINNTNNTPNRIALTTIGNVGIGTAIPNGSLDVEGTLYPTVFYGNGNSNEFVGIGTYAPITPLEVMQSSAGGIQVQGITGVNSGNAGFNLKAATGLTADFFNDATNVGIYNGTSDIFTQNLTNGNLITLGTLTVQGAGTSSISGSLNVGSSSQFQIDSGGGVTTSSLNGYRSTAYPSVYGSKMSTLGSATNYYGSGNNSGHANIIATSSTGGASDSVTLNVGNNGTSGGLTVVDANNSSANVGIGISNPGAALDVESTVSPANFVFNGNNVSGVNVGIGSKSPGDNLDVNGTIRSTGFNFNGPTGVGYVLTDAGGTGNLTMAASSAGSGLVVSGTVNYGAFYPSSTATVQATPAIQYLGNNVGINQVPAQNLDINGTVHINGNLGISVTNPAALLDVQGTLQHFYVAQNGNVGIGTPNPTQPFAVGTSSGVGIAVSSSGNITFAAGNGSLSSTQLLWNTSSVTIENNNSGAGSNLTVKGGTGSSSVLNLQSTNGAGTTDSIRFLTGTASERARIDTNGNVGIGTTTPQASLDVWGTLSLTHDLIATANGNIGVGVVSPGVALDVNGTVRSTGFTMSTAPTTGYVLTATDSQGDAIWSAATGGTGTNYWAQSPGNVGIFTGSPTNPQNVGIGTVSPQGLFQVVGAGNVGINSTNPGQTLDVFGTIRSTTYINSLSKVCTVTLSSSSSGICSGLVPGNNYYMVLAFDQNTTNGQTNILFNADAGANYSSFNYINSGSGPGSANLTSTNSVNIASNTVAGHPYLETMYFSTDPSTTSKVEYNFTITLTSSNQAGIQIDFGGGEYIGASSLTSVTTSASAGTMTGTMTLYKIN